MFQTNRVNVPFKIGLNLDLNLILKFVSNDKIVN